MANSPYGGAYTAGSKAGRHNNDQGLAAEKLLISTLDQLGHRRDRDYYYHQRVPYFSPDKFRKISASFLFPSSSPAASLSHDIISDVTHSGGPNIVEDVVFGERTEGVLSADTIISVTQANPTKPGHSIENKLHQALGELYLHKIFNPSTRSILFIGGAARGWATPEQIKKYGRSYALSTFQLFFDDVIFSWEKGLNDRVKEALTCKLKNEDFWRAEKSRADSISLSTDVASVPSKNLRDEFMKGVLIPLCQQKILVPEDITNEVTRFMVDCSINANAGFWGKILAKNIKGIEVDRVFNNPSEAAIALLLKQTGVPYQAEIEHKKSHVVVGENLLYDLGFGDMHRYTDFVLKATDGLPIYIESKSAGGGFEGGHKHITDRAREQIARSLLHRTRFINDKLVSNLQHFHWIFVLDADWCTPNIYPLKFIHVLQLAGAERWFTARDLLDASFSINAKCDFITYLKQLCS